MTALGIGSTQLTPGLDLHPLQTSSCPELPDHSSLQQLKLTLAECLLLPEGSWR